MNMHMVNLWSVTAQQHQLSEAAQTAGAYPNWSILHEAWQGVTNTNICYKGSEQQQIVMKQLFFSLLFHFTF